METRAPLHHKSSYCTKNSHNKLRLILYLRRIIIYLFIYLFIFAVVTVYKNRINLDEWRTMQHFVSKEGFFYKFYISWGYIFTTFWRREGMKIFLYFLFFLSTVLELPTLPLPLNRSALLQTV